MPGPSPASWHCHAGLWQSADAAATAIDCYLNLQLKPLPEPISRMIDGMFLIFHLSIVIAASRRATAAVSITTSNLYHSCCYCC